MSEKGDAVTRSVEIPDAAVKAAELAAQAAYQEYGRVAK